PAQRRPQHRILQQSAHGAPCDASVPDHAAAGGVVRRLARRISVTSANLKARMMHQHYPGPLFWFRLRQNSKRGAPTTRFAHSTHTAVPTYTGCVSNSSPTVIG